MKLNREFLLYSTESETVLVPTGAADFAGMVRGNKTLGMVLELLRSDTDASAIVAALKARCEAPEGAIEADVAKVLAELRKIGALDA